MAPAFRRSGSRYCAPSLTSHHIFSHVTMTSPNAASTMGLPESRADTLQHVQAMPDCQVAGVKCQHLSKQPLRSSDPAL